MDCKNNEITNFQQYCYSIELYNKKCLKFNEYVGTELKKLDLQMINKSFNDFK